MCGKGRGVSSRSKQHDFSVQSSTSTPQKVRNHAALTATWVSNTHHNIPHHHILPSTHIFIASYLRTRISSHNRIFAYIRIIKSSRHDIFVPSHHHIGHTVTSSQLQAVIYFTFLSKTIFTASQNHVVRTWNPVNNYEEKKKQFYKIITTASAASSTD